VLVDGVGEAVPVPVDTLLVPEVVDDPVEVAVAEDSVEREQPSGFSLIWTDWLSVAYL
jgi:hypothetical protein